MKKLDKLKLAESGKLMNEDEMKHIFGGYSHENIGGVVSCSISLSCGGGSISCTSTLGKCEYIYSDSGILNGQATGIKCEDTVYSCKQ